MASFANKEHQFLADLGLAPRNPGSYACGAWGGSGPVVTTTNPTNNEVIAEVVEASVDDYEKGVSACFDAAKTWMASCMPQVRGECCASLKNRAERLASRRLVIIMPPLGLSEELRCDPLIGEASFPQHPLIVTVRTKVLFSTMVYVLSLF